jgi:hypothetical protein
MAGGILELVTAAGINILTCVAFLAGFALLKNQPLNTRVYYPRWFVNGEEDRLSDFVRLGNKKGSVTGQYVNLNWKSYAHVMDWVVITLRMPEEELIQLVGLDSAVFLRIFRLGYVPFLFFSCSQVTSAPCCPRLLVGHGVDAATWCCSSCAD